MNTEEDEFKRIEREAKRRAAQADDDDTQDYVRGHYTVEQMLTWGKATAEAEREACAKVCESHVSYPSRLHFAEAIRARGNK